MEENHQESYFFKIFERVRTSQEVTTPVQIQKTDWDVIMEEDKSADLIEWAEVQFNDIKQETDHLSCKEISSLVVSEFWRQTDSNRTLKFLSDRLEGIQLYDQKEDSKELHPSDAAHTFNRDSERRIFKDAQVNVGREPGYKFSELQEFFLNKKLHQKIPVEIKLKLILEMKMNNKSIKEMWKKYFIWSSTMKLIMNEVSDYDNFCNKVLEEEQSHLTRQEDVKIWIRRYICDQRGGVTAKKIKDHVIKTLGKTISLSEIRWYLKQNLNLSFKKGWPRPADIDNNKISLLRILYTIRLAKAINNKILTINVDESSFSNELWNERSWLKRGVNSEIISMRFRGSVSLILAVTSDGDYFGATIKSRLNSDSFIDFILKLEDWIEQRNIRNGREIIVILDNCSIHRSRVTKEALKETKIKFWYLPQYSPSLAPVELVFAQLKKFIRNKEGQSIIRWNSIDGQTLLTLGLSSIESSTIVGWWEHTFSVMNSYMISLRKKLKES